MWRIAIIVYTSLLMGCGQNRQEKKLDGDNIVNPSDVLGIKKPTSGNKLWLDELLESRESSFNVMLFDSFDFSEGTVILRKKIFEGPLSREPIRTHLHCLDICIKSLDSLYIDGIYCPKIDLQGRIVKYINYLVQNDSFGNPNLHPLFQIGDSVVPYSCINIGMTSLSYNNGEVDWENYNNFLSSIIMIIGEIRDKMCLLKFSKPFSLLSSYEKVSILRFTSIRILLTFDMNECAVVILPVPE